MDEKQTEPKRTHLKRAGMHPITEDFAELYARRRQRRYYQRGDKEKPVSCTPEEFKTACRALGIGSAKELGEIIGRDRQTDGARARLGQRRMNAPEDLTMIEMFEITRRYNDVTGPLLEEMELAESYGMSARKEEREFESIYEACAPLFTGSKEEIEEKRAFEDEYTHRFAIEAAKTLSATGRRNLLTVLMGLLALERDGGNQEAGTLLESWTVTEGGKRVDEERLADLIRGHGAMQLEVEKESFEGRVRDTATGRTTKARNITDALLQEYAELISPEYGDD